MTLKNRRSIGVGTTLRHLFSAPFILLPFLPMIALHICVEIYHQVAFRLYGLPLYNLANYIKFDREKLPFLKGEQWLYCAYCTYMNGAIGYVGAIAGKTEWYWCGMKHNKDSNLINPEYQKKFAEFGDKTVF